MNRIKALTVLIAGMAMASGAQAATTLGVTVYKYDDNFMSVVRRAIEGEAEAVEGRAPVNE